MKKIEQIVREEQNLIGGSRNVNVTIQSSDIWKESGSTMITVKNAELKTDKEEKCCMAPQMKR